MNYQRLDSNSPNYQNVLKKEPILSKYAYNTPVVGDGSQATPVAAIPKHQFSFLFKNKILVFFFNLFLVFLFV
jgi:hypothetical protein